MAINFSAAREAVTGETRKTAATGGDRLEPHVAKALPLTVSDDQEEFDATDSDRAESGADFPEDHFVDELKPGTSLLHGQYTIQGFLNSGGFGITYLARDSLERTVVIKECFPGSFCRRSNTIVRARSRAHHSDFRAVVRLFVQEARNLAKLSHPNIVGVHQVFEDNDTAYMAIDYIEGRDLLDIIEDGDRVFSPEETVRHLVKLLGAVAFIHERGILHRDISPDNILIGTSGEPVLIDFGAAREHASQASRALSALRVVKDGYSPQEFYISGSVQGPSSDLYGLAASFYHLITGKAPPDSQRRLAAIADDSGDPYERLAGRVPGFPPGFLEALDKAISVLPRDRIGSARDWLALIEARPAQKPSEPVVTLAPAARRAARAELAALRATVPRPEAPRRGGASALVLGAALVAAAAAFTIFSLGSDSGKPAVIGAAPGLAVTAAAANQTAPGAAGPAGQGASAGAAIPPAAVKKAAASPAAAVAPAPVIAAPPAAVVAPAPPVEPPLPAVALTQVRAAPSVAVRTSAEGAAAATPRPAALPSAVAAGRWELALPFETRPVRLGVDSFPMIERVLPSAAGLPGNDWLAEGVTIYAVNERWVSDQASIEDIVLDLPLDSGAGVVIASLRVRATAGAPFQQVTLAVPGTRTTTLNNGAVIRTSRVDGAWQVVVESVSAGKDGGLVPGDILVSERNTGETLAAPLGFETVLGRLARAGVVEATFEVSRGGALNEASLSLVGE